jgi:putative methionine-R-sulfoxide reductase with GAF domain
LIDGSFEVINWTIFYFFDDSSSELKKVLYKGEVEYVDVRFIATNDEVIFLLKRN